MLFYYIEYSLIKKKKNRKRKIIKPEDIVKFKYLDYRINNYSKIIEQLFLVKKIKNNRCYITNINDGSVIITDKKYLEIVNIKINESYQNQKQTSVA
jgi:hypothetical protein